MIYFAIRHKRTGELMPQAKRDRGYSHWNPDKPEHNFNRKLDVPRLISSRKKAVRCISMWVANPNGRETSSQNRYTGEYENDVIFINDDRSSDDLEVVKIELRILKL